MESLPKSTRAYLVKLPERLHVSYDKAFQLVKHLEPQICALDIECIVAVLRSGAVPAMMLSQRIDKPVVFCQCHRGNEKATWLQPVALHGKRALIVDDFCASGITLNKVTDLVREAGGDAKTMALFFAEDTVTRPDIGHLARKYVAFAWDRLEVTPSSRKLFAEANSRYAPEDVEEFYGVDLDGFVIADFPRTISETSGQLAGTLSVGDALSLFRKLPPSHAVAITARSEEDTQRTRAWLDRNQLSCVPLVRLGDQRHAYTSRQAAQAKARVLCELGVSTFYESDLQQATLIAEKCPNTDVIWWRPTEPLRIAAERVD